MHSNKEWPKVGQEYISRFGGLRVVIVSVCCQHEDVDNGYETEPIVVYREKTTSVSEYSTDLWLELGYFLEVFYLPKTILYI